MQDSRLALLRQHVLSLPVPGTAHKVLLQSIEYFQGHLRPNRSQRGVPPHARTLRQAPLSGMTDRAFQEQTGEKRWRA